MNPIGHWADSRPSPVKGIKKPSLLDIDDDLEADSGIVNLGSGTVSLNFDSINTGPNHRQPRYQPRLRCPSIEFGNCQPRQQLPSASSVTVIDLVDDRHQPRRRPSSTSSATVINLANLARYCHQPQHQPQICHHKHRLQPPLQAGTGGEIGAR